jgi:RNA polymerase sigma factor (sigma-70 family)
MNYKNKDGADKLVKEHSSALVRFLTRRMKSREDAEDIAQAAYLRLYTLDDLGRLSNAKAFLFQVAANMSIDQLRPEVLNKNYLDKEISKVPKDRSRESGAWSREDVQVSYHFNSGESLITLGVENILDQMPPFLGSAFNDNFDVRTNDSTGRFVYARLSHSL